MAGFTKEQAEAILMACREAAPAMFGPAFVMPIGNGSWRIRRPPTGEDDAIGAETVAKATRLLGITTVDTIVSKRGSQVVHKVAVTP